MARPPPVPLTPAPLPTVPVTYPKLELVQVEDFGFTFPAAAGARAGDDYDGFELTLPE